MHDRHSFQTCIGILLCRGCLLYDLLKDLFKAAGTTIFQRGRQRAGHIAEAFGIAVHAVPPQIHHGRNTHRCGCVYTVHGGIGTIERSYQQIISCCTYGFRFFSGSRHQLRRNNFAGDTGHAGFCRGIGIGGFHTGKRIAHQFLHIGHAQLFIDLFRRTAAVLDFQSIRISGFQDHIVGFHQFGNQILAVTAIHHQVALLDHNRTGCIILYQCYQHLHLIFRINGQQRKRRCGFCGITFCFHIMKIVGFTHILVDVPIGHSSVREEGTVENIHTFYHSLHCFSEYIRINKTRIVQHKANGIVIVVTEQELGSFATTCGSDLGDCHRECSFQNGDFLISYY